MRCRECFDGSSPAEIVWQIGCCDAVEAAHPFLEATVVGVDIVDMQVRRLGGGPARSGQDVKGEAGGVEARQDGIDGRPAAFARSPEQALPPALEGLKNKCLIRQAGRVMAR